MSNKINNSLVWGFDTKNTIQILKELKSKHNFNHKVWIKDGHEKTNINCEVISYNELCIQHKFSTNTQTLSLKDSRNLESLLLDFILLNSRHQCFKYPLESTITRNIYDDYHLFYRFIHFFAQIIKQHNINIILFSNLPHEGPDFLIYHVAKYLKIKTILFYQTLFINKCYCIKDIKEISDIQTTGITLSDPIKFKLKDHLKKQFYMTTVDSATHQKDELEKLYTTEEFLKKNRFTILKLLIKGNFKKIGSLLNNKGPGSRINKLKTYINNHDKYVTKTINLNRKFVYFPLHLQPELTTDTLGNEYKDQLRAIEDLSEWLPEDVLIYIKENPKQWESHRPPDFFDRLRCLERVILVSSKTESLSLINHALFTATITGTAGWESILSGKNTLTFGNAWYNNLPGVFQFKESPNYKTLVSFKITPKDLYTSIEKLTTFLSDGIVDDAYINIFDNYCPKKNATLITKSITALLNNK